MTKLLFHKKDLGALIEYQRKSVRAQVESVPEDQFLSSSAELVREHLLSKLRLDHLVIYEDRIEQKLVQGKRDATDRFRYDLRPGEKLIVPSLEMIVTVPYSGPQELWDFRPSMFTEPLRGDAGRLDSKTGIGFITLTAAIDAQTQQPEQLQREMNSLLEHLRNRVSSQKTNIDQFNAELPRIIDDNVAWRRKNYDRFFAAAEKLKLPIAVKADAPPLKPIAIEKRVVKALPPATTSAVAPQEPGISDHTYEQILQAIRNQGRQFERTPATYTKHDEEELRDILWGNLSTHFGKDVNAEAFSRSGKTDIRIDDDGRAAFIAECKVWRGPKEIQAAVDQLLGYLRWRDCKTALIVFNKDRGNFTSILDRGPVALREAKLFRGDAGNKSEAGESRMVFASPDDDSRRVTVHLFLFDLYVSKGG